MIYVAFIPFVILIIAVIISSAYPLLLHRLQGNFLQRLYIKYLCNAALLVPIVLIETQRKISGGGLSLSDALGPRTLVKNYINSLFLTLWNVFFCLALRYTEVSSVLYFSNIMLLIWVFNKIFRRASGISELEIKGSVIFLIGILIFGMKQLISNIDETHTISLYESHKLYGVGYAVLASVCAAYFLITNYELTYYLPSYTSLLVITIFSLANLEALNFGISLIDSINYPFSFLTISGTCI